MAIVVAESGKGKFTEEIVIGNHILIADEPLESGGNDLGPSPYDFLLAALGSCTCMTVRMYADFKKIPLKRIIVRLQHEKVHAKDCVDCENNNARLDQINRQIELQGELSEGERNRLLDIANKCPIHRTLTSSVSIATELVTKIESQV